MIINRGLCTVGSRNVYAGRLLHSSNVVLAPLATAASTSNPSKKNSRPFHLQKLNGRSLIRVHGELATDFLQSLITNDIHHLTDATRKTNSTSLYTMFLNKSGRVLYDSIIHKPNETENTYLIECDRHIDVELQKHMKIFRVRKKIDIDVVDREQSVWVAFDPHAAYDEGILEVPAPASSLFIGNDPRVRQLGTRIIAPSELSILDALPKCNLVSVAGDNEYTEHRYRLGVGEGVDELPIGKCFPLEANCDYLHGVSFHKGCYLGQEFTARTHHTGVVRKRLMPVRFQGEARLTSKSSKHVETTDGIVLGKTRGLCGNYGLALLKFETALKESSALVFGGADDGGVLGRTMRPQWWPQEAPALDMLKEKPIPEITI